jgi:hypothetical protein
MSDQKKTQPDEPGRPEAEFDFFNWVWKWLERWYPLDSQSARRSDPNWKGKDGL